MAQWSRAEPGFRQKTAEEVDAWVSEGDAEVRARHLADDEQR
jgi:hypothetical protein